MVKDIPALGDNLCTSSSFSYLVSLKVPFDVSIGDQMKFDSVK